MFRNFNLNCTVRIVVAGATMVILVIAAMQGYYASTAVIAVIMLFEIASLLHYVNKTNRDLTRFLSGIENADFSQSFSSRGLGKSFDELADAFSRVVERFQSIRAEKEENVQYLQTIVRHVGTGLIAFEPDGRIRLFNNAAKRILDLPAANRLNDLVAVSKHLPDRIRNMESGEHILFKAVRDSELKQLSLRATRITLRGEPLTLVSLQDIQPELEEKEMESWQKLIRVLTHEIMNSITPIGSLADTARELLKETDPAGEHCRELDDVREALTTIARRSDNLLEFVHAYRNLTRIPRPTFQTIPVSQLLDRVQQLLGSQLETNRIRMNVQVQPESLTLTADPALVEQVLINLTVNAIHALKDNPDGQIDVHAGMDGRGRVCIHVTDNGPGIDADAMDKIFIPFFSTRKDGSGIGLSLSRQIMRAHKGSITVVSDPGVSTTFMLKF